MTVHRKFLPILTRNKLIKNLHNVNNAQASVHRQQLQNQVPAGNNNTYNQVGIKIFYPHINSGSFEIHFGVLHLHASIL